jgi:hypothetical protein
MRNHRGVVVECPIRFADGIRRGAMRDGHERRPDCTVSISPSAVLLMPEMRRTSSSLSFSSRSDWRLTQLDLRRGNLAPPLDIEARARAEPLEIALLYRIERLLVVHPADIGGAGGDLDAGRAALVFACGSIRSSNHAASLMAGPASLRCLPGSVHLAIESSPSAGSGEQSVGLIRRSTISAMLRPPQSPSP